MSELDLFKGITKEHVKKAIQLIDAEGYPPPRRSSTYDLLASEITYPPKYVISLAGHVRDGRYIRHSEFSGGESSACFAYLRNLGFTILPKEKTSNYKKALENPETTGKYINDDLGNMDKPEFFTEDDLVQLAKFTGQRLDRKIHEQEQTYQKLKVTYGKIEYWAEEVRKRLFSEGAIQVKKKPTNQANRFEDYLWAKIYPSQGLKEWKLLAYTVVISNKEGYNVKIDTVGLGEGNSLRKKYLDYRGDYRNSKIVKIFSPAEVIAGDWEKLISASCETIRSVEKEYKSLLNLLGFHETHAQKEKSAEPLSLNTILYGPPGTGKTYHSIDKAVEIIRGESYDDHDQNKEEFDRLRKEGQIEFLTFHQNYTYEDFIVGLKPDLAEASQLKFKRVEGIFYRLCKRAEQNYINSKESMADLTPFEDVFTEFLLPLTLRDEKIVIPMDSGKASFKITDINPSNLSFEKQSGGTHHTLNIDTIRELYEGSREFTSGLRYYYTPLLEKLWSMGKQPKAPVKLKKYVLVIDEINRANISKVFGELITLLEEDKRIGKDNELRISIPGADKEFGVPPNLYLVGTMNTADKSIALIDIALRRRFEFIGMYPSYEDIDNAEAAELLKLINKAVYERKLSADYLIGHAYFMNGDTIEKTLSNKVIPLLSEYFMGKHKLVEEIFKDTTWSATYNEDTYFWEVERR